MLVAFTPYTYLFFSFYILMLFFICSVSDFFSYWFIMELMALTFVGLSFTLFSHSLAQLMVYFFIQSISSFGFMIAWLSGGVSLMFTVALILKLGMFPFHSWYMGVLTRFPTFLFLLATTVHKVPPLLMVSFFSVQLFSSVIWSSMLFSVLIAGFIMLSTSDLRLLLSASSVGNNSWLILSVELSLEVFFSFLVIYFFFSAGLFFILGQRYFFPVTDFPLVMFFLVALSGLPPFPVFFVKMVIVSFLVSHSSGLLFIFLLFNFFMVSGYIVFCMTTIVFSFYSFCVLSP